MTDHITRLQSARIGRLATLDIGGQPNVLPVCFVMDGDRTIYTAVDRKPKKVAPERLARVRNILSNARVALVVDRYEEDWQELWYVLVRGTAALIPGQPTEERAHALALLGEKYPQYRTGLLPDDAPIIRIDIERITGWESRAS
jgi:PPOX class probable F420-dependent enzyme